MQLILDGNKPKTVLHFNSQRVRWEYIFFQRNGNSRPETGLKLEDANKQIAFSNLKMITAYGRNGMSMTTEETIPKRTAYGSKLRLVHQEESKQKHILLANIEPPIPGRFVTDEGLCYY